MNNRRLKVGCGYIRHEKTLKDLTKSLKQYIDNMICKHLCINKYETLDIHGGTLLYSEDQNDIFYKSNLIAIGDTISSVNPLGGEGIRHCMFSATKAAIFIKMMIENRIDSFEDYKKEMLEYFGIKWKLCEKFAKLVYIRLSDKAIDKGFSYFSGLSAEELMDILFRYEFDKIDNALDNFIIRKLKTFIT